MSKPPPLSPRTLAAQALGTIDESTRAIVPPIHLATTFERDPDNLYRSGNSYGRPDNETVREAEAVLASELRAASSDSLLVRGDTAIDFLGLVGVSVVCVSSGAVLTRIIQHNHP